MRYHYIEIDRAAFARRTAEQLAFQAGQKMVRTVGISAVTAASLLLMTAVAITIWRF